MANDYINLGEGKWKGQWISKQFLVEYLRCEYRVFYSLSKGIPITDLKETALLRLLWEKGLEFEAGVVQDSEPIEVQTKESITPLSNKSLLIRVPNIIRNHELGIQGIPDLINTDDGKFIPIEIKNHKEVTGLDELELAFYWLLLEPLRKKKVKAKGYIVLNTGEIVEVPIAKEHLLDVQLLLDDLREMLKEGTEPVLSSECKTCNLYKECHEQVIHSGGLSIIYNISYRRERQLKDIGINSISQLMKADEEEVNAKLISKFRSTPGVNELFRMKCHAFSISSGKPFFLGQQQQVSMLTSSPLFVVDLEYDPTHLLWLIGIAVRNKKQTKYYQFFAEKENLEEEERILKSFVELRRKYLSHPFITYSGLSADLPQMRKAWYRHDFDFDEFIAIKNSHIDVCEFLQNSFRFPMKSMGLGGMEEYLGIQRQSPISGGLEALAEYKRYLRTRDESLKQQLLDYNKEDITSTLSIIDKMSELVNESITI
jgi:predicted RecB family nuclease